MVLLEFSIFPLDKGTSLSPYVARCLRLIDESGLDYQLHSMGTIVEGEINQVLDVLRACHEALAADCDRISCTAKLDYRHGQSGRLVSKVESVKRQVGRDLQTGTARADN